MDIFVLDIDIDIDIFVFLYFHETRNMDPNLSAPLNVPLNDQQHFRLNKINEIKDYFVAEIKERELMSKRLSKYIAL